METGKSITPQRIKSLRLRDSECDILEQAADIKGLSFHAFVKHAAIERAKRVVRWREQQS